MQEFIDAALAADDYTWTICTVLSLLCAFVTGVILGEWEKGVLYFPPLLFGGLLGNRAFIVNSWFLSPDKEINVVAVTAACMMGALILTLFLMKGLHMIGGSSKPVGKPAPPARRAF